MVNTLFYPHVFGGAEKSVQLLSQGLADQGHEVVVVSVAPARDVKYVGGLKVYYLPPHNIYWGGMFGRAGRLKKLLWHLGDIFNPGIYRELSGIADRERPDIIHTHMLTGLSAAPWVIARRRGIPVVHTLREYSLICESATMFRDNTNCSGQCRACGAFTALKKYLCNHGTIKHVVGLSNFIIARHLQQGYFKGVPYSRVFNGIEVPTTPSRLLPGLAGPVKILYLGRIERGKGVWEILEAAQQMAGIELYLGGRVLDDEIREKIKQQKYPAHIQFLGFIDPQEILDQIDVVIVPSRWHEPFGRVVIEAYQYGKPVIASHRGGLPEIVIEGKTGFLYNPDHVQELLAILKRLTTDPGLIPALHSHIAEHLQQFDNNHIARQYEQIYQSVIKHDIN